MNFSHYSIIRFRFSKITKMVMMIIHQHHLVLQSNHQIKIMLNIIFMIVYFQQDHQHLRIQALLEVH